MPEPIRHIVFDIGQVLITYDNEIPFRALIPDQRERRWFLENVCTHDWNLEQDRGRSWAEAEAEAIRRHPDHAGNIRAYRANWHKMVESDIPGSVEILRALIAAGHDLTLLTNFAADTLLEAGERFSFLNETRGVTVSALVGLLKPQREIYDHHVRTFGLEPAATLFIDDSAKNVAGAISAGWQAVQFHDPQRLNADLARLGIAC